jgi:hypothetical protein
MIIPLMDTARIIIIRLYKKTSLFVPDKRHIHHVLVRLDLTHKQAVYILTFVHVIFFSIAILMRNLSDWYVLGLIVALATTLCLILDSVHKAYLRSRDGK